MYFLIPQMNEDEGLIHCYKVERIKKTWVVNNEKLIKDSSGFQATNDGKLIQKC